VDHAVAVVEGSVVQPEDLPGAIRSPRLLPRVSSAGAEYGRQPGGYGMADTRADYGAGRGDGLPGGAAGAAAEAARDDWSLADVEREHIRRVLARHRGNATYAARQLGISRTTLWRKLRQYGLSRTG
jgi:transcriptional regulator of acetoin/glycerol metabolism